MRLKLLKKSSIRCPNIFSVLIFVLFFTFLVPVARAGDVVEDNFDDGVIDEFLWAPSCTGSGQIEEADGVLKTSAQAGVEGWGELDSQFELVGDFDVWLEYDWAMYEGDDSRTHLRIWNTAHTELLALNCHRWNLGYSREIIFTYWKEVGGVLVEQVKVWVTSSSVPLSGKLRIQRQGNMVYGYYKNLTSENWTLLGSGEASTFGTTSYVNLVSNNRSNSYPNGAFEVHWDNFHAEAFEINGLKPTSPPVADAGGPYLVEVNQSITLDGSSSYDPDEDTLTYFWTQDDLLGRFNLETDENPTYSGIQAGITNLKLTVSDGLANDSDSTMIVVYDPSGGFVTGGGWIISPIGALLDSEATGKANFGFVAKYKKGATIPEGNTEFRFQAGTFAFKSSSYDWLVVAGSKAIFKGDGTIEGMEGTYKFMLTAIDDTQDKFRIKIWNPETDDIIYDNKRGENDDAEPTVIGGGSIVIHK